MKTAIILTLTLLPVFAQAAKMDPWNYACEKEREQCVSLGYKYADKNGRDVFANCVLAVAKGYAPPTLKLNESAECKKEAIAADLQYNKK